MLNSRLFALGAQPRTRCMDEQDICYSGLMFADDYGRLKQVEEWLILLEEGLAQPNLAADEVTWWRLGMVEKACSGLTLAYRAQHPEIEALGLPTLDQVLTKPPPSRSVSAAIARGAIAVFEPLLSRPPPCASGRPPSANPFSRFDEVVKMLIKMEPYLRSQGFSALYLFGSVARREDHPGSDVDLAFSLTNDASVTFSLLDQSRLGRELGEALGAGVDLVQWGRLRERLLHQALAQRVTIFD